MNYIRMPLLMMVLLLSLTHLNAHAQQADDTLSDEATSHPSLEQVLEEFAAQEQRRSPDFIDAISPLDDPRASLILSALLNGDIYVVPAGDNRPAPMVVIAQRRDNTLTIRDAITDEPLGEIANRDADRLTLNNALRRSLRLQLAARDLADERPRVRQQAISYLMGQNLNTLNSMRPTLEILTEEDGNAGIRTSAAQAIALLDLSSENPDVRDQALDVVAGSINNAVRNILTRIAANDPDPQIREKAQLQLNRIEGRIVWLQRLETLFFGLSLGSVLLLAAVGLAITFGVMGVINMAHGELIMLGAYTTYVVQMLLPDHVGLSILVAIPAAFLVSGIFGVAIERGVIRFLYGRPLETLLATFGISLILQQLVRSVFSPLNRVVNSPDWMSGQLQINEVLALNYNRLYVLAFSLLVFLFLWVILKKTRLGIEVRAVTQNRQMARAIGVRSGKVDALTFGLGAGVAGMAGVALSQLTNVGPNMGQAYIIDSFMVVVFGGAGNLFGAFYSAFILGIMTKFLEPAVGAIVAKILILVFIILFIQRQPRGLFPVKGRGVDE